MPLTKADAREMVGASIDWGIGLEASIEKWEQIASGDRTSYTRGQSCGLCFVADNLGTGCQGCPAVHVCEVIFGNADTEDILRMLREIHLPEQ